MQTKVGQGIIPRLACLAGFQLLSVYVHAMQMLFISVVMLQITVLYTRPAVPDQGREPTIKWQPR